MRALRGNLPLHQVVHSVVHAESRLMVFNSVSSYCGDMDPIRWTPYMDECLQSLRETKESPFDEGFIIQVRAQRLFQAVKDFALLRGLAGMPCKTPRPPATSRRIFDSEMAKIRDDVSTQIPNYGEARDRWDASTCTDTVLYSLCYVSYQLYPAQLPRDGSHEWMSHIASSTGSG